ncbi:hypothetical protein WMY93_022024 [Mugilogobius chulae]|uniref:Uncharacterized protein n=1 Tax=Mugilogobius chulae TaxID=88201 RepID=A0AAW0NGZ1_9GOBI
MYCEWLPSILQLIGKERDFSPEKYSCSVCSEVLQKPATIPCGHTFCAQCVTEHWDGEDGRYTCPQCGKKFSPRPVLVRNIPLENEMKAVIDKVASFVYAKPGEVACDVCPRKKRKAISTCMGCRIAFCESHLWDHYIGKEPYKTHQLVNPGINLKENVCPVHHQYITMYCCTDHQVVCPSCAERQHKGHQIISTTAEMKRRKTAMVSEKETLKARLQHHKKVRDSIENMIDSLTTNADSEVTLRTSRFSGFIQQMRRRAYEVEDEVVAHKRSLQKLEDCMEQEIMELKRQEAELDSLSLIQDPAQTPDMLQHGTGFDPKPSLLKQPITREQYLKYAVNITLDPNTHTNDWCCQRTTAKSLW